METERVEPQQGVRVRLRIDCVSRTDRDSPYHRIRAVGGTRREDERWRLSEEAAIAAIENERATFYLERTPGSRIDVVVGEASGKRYLRATVDREAPDALLELPDCE